MLLHAIAPVRRFTKVSHDVVRNRRLNSDAKILIIYIQGLPGDKAAAALSKHAEELGMTPRAFQRAKEALIACGYFHEWKWQGGRGRWHTDQLLSNVTLTREGANDVRDGVLVLDPEEQPPPPPGVPIAPGLPTPRKPAVGEPEGPVAGPCPPEDEDREKEHSHLPPETPDVPDVPDAEAPPTPTPTPTPTPNPAPVEVVEAERVLLSLRHTHRELMLGAREVRGLAEVAAEWLRRGLSTADLRHALTSGLPPGGVRSAAGFLRHRLVEKLPVPAGGATRAPGALVACEGPGPDHVFRPVGDETRCGPCRLGAAHAPRRPDAVSWRARLASGALSAQAPG
ncbi:hypothetical protein [Streptomyces sp. SP18CS02]|uniref:hypothetical protein n=1 Tax=Streptomyces sp. SP18CS02 TaxID=3002531 RepID=UPI002E79E4F2|nr:hypothetical protein [Streptomyces sp. SP18CS02]MEE1755713.1 hypothetical protein [Streptomyces sp. SP18CS02]